MTAIRPDGAGGIQGCALRVARLATDGSVPVGATDMWQQDALVKLDAKANVQKGVEIPITTACGSIYAFYHDFDRTKFWDITLTVASMDPEAQEIISAGSGSLITIGGNSTGYQAPPLNQSNFPAGCSLEVWTKAIIGSFQVPGDRVVTDGVLASSTALVSATANFTSADVGSKVTGTGIPTNTTIASVTDSSHAVMSAAATATSTGVTVTIISLTATPWFRWVLPRCFLYPDQRTVENKDVPQTFTGFAVENPNWLTGPVDDWRTGLAPGVGSALPSNRTIQWNRDLALPTPLEPGYQTTTA
jgi:hypothetical protein